MATIRERLSSKGERRWQAIVRREGYPTKRATFPAKRDAERWAKIVEGDYAKARHLPSLEAERHTVSDLFDRYLREQSEKWKKNRAAHVAFWRAEIGSKRLSEITPALVRELRDKLVREPYTRSKPRKAVTLTKRRERKEGDPPPKTYHRSPASVNRYMETLAKVFGVAVAEYEWMPENPARKIADLKETRGRVRFLTTEERTALLEACQAESADLYDLVIAALCTGARAGELLDLRWPDVDLTRKTAVLHHTKNDERRTLTLAGPALDVFKARSKLRRIDTDRVFPHPTTTGRYDYAKPFRAAVAEAKVDDFRFHDLRHTAASYLAMHGATTAEIAAVLGHKTLAMVKRYAHLSEQHVAGVVERMTGSVFGDSGKAAS